ncbi:site-specific integrase [Vibrio parahaemolyticus]|uniref:site-specific integrase n=1 Tax=Vibrio parahaemolyticus TaxID=670 RepID=UPI00215C35F3|nr:site-specific integrase [Vibrio parahaemolyticus]MCR9821137.1 site-specific integrase [Vibrio parahaemolyticus]
MDITYLIDQLHDVDSAGLVKLKKLSLEQYQRLNECVLWRTERGKLSLIKNVVFGDERYEGKGRKDGLILFTGARLLDYELKSLALIYHKIGFIEGDYGFKWSSTKGILHPLQKLARFLSEKNYDSFRQFDQVHTIIQRNLLNNFLMASSIENGLDLQGTMSSRKAIQDSLPVLHRYGLISDITAAAFYDAIDSIPSIECDDYSSSHPVIPTGILKQVIQQSKERIDEAERLLPKWEKANERLINVLAKGKVKFASKLSDNASEVVRRYLVHHSSDHKSLKEELVRLHEPFKRLRVDIYVQILTFTGMRNQEVGALKNSAEKSRDDRFYIQSVLSKTTRSKMTLNWVSNEDAYRAVSLLSRYNKSMLDRAKVLLEYHRDEMTQDLIYHLEDGIKQNELFGVIPSASSIRFTDKCEIKTRTKDYSGKEGRFNLYEYRFELSERDIQQLDMMTCNYRGMYGKNRRTRYNPGDKFNITPHQFRHTFAWFIIANRLGDLDDIKYQFKHLASSMSMVYAHRGYETIEELLNVVEGFDAQVTEKLATELAAKAQVRRLSGGGGQRWVKAAEALEISITNVDMVKNDNAEITKKKTLHFKDVEQYKAFLVKHLKGVRGLPHGLCTGGEDCKIKNAAVPTGCVLCGNYLVSERHLPHWKAMESYALNKLCIFEQALPEQQAPYQLLAKSWRATVKAARMIIEQIETGKDQPFEEFRA